MLQELNMKEFRFFVGKTKLLKISYTKEWSLKLYWSKSWDIYLTRKKIYNEDSSLKLLSISVWKCTLKFSG